MDPEKRAMMRMFDSMLGSMMREQFPGLAETEANYVSPGEEQEAFFEAVEEADISAIRRWLENEKVDIKARNKSGWTALHLASLKGNLFMVKMFLDAGAPVDAKTEPFHETALHLAAAYGFVEVLSLLLERGASPFSIDCHGRSVIELANRGARPQAKEENMEKVRKLLAEKAAEAKPVEKGKRREDGCGKCGEKGVDLKQCARCRLSYYCSSECQKEDWKLHKPRCTQAKDLWTAIATIGNMSASNHARDTAMDRLAGQREFVKKMKCLKALLEIVPRDKEIHSGAYNHAYSQRYPVVPSLYVLSLLLMEQRMEDGVLTRGLWDDRDFMTQLIDLNGVEIVLKRLMKGDMSTKMQNEGFRFIATPFGTSTFASWFTRRLLSKGDGSKIVTLLAPAVKMSTAAKAQSAAIIGRLVREEGLVLKKAGKASTEFGPATEAMFQTTDLRFFAKAARGDEDVMGDDGAFQGALTFFVGITCDRKEVLERLIKDLRQTAFILVEAYAKALFYPGEGAWCLGLEFLARALEHVPSFASGLFADVMRSWDNSRNPDVLGNTQRGFCYRIAEGLDINEYEELNVEFAADPEGTGAPLKNWENAAFICLELIRHCPLLRHQWNLGEMFDFRQGNPNRKAQAMMHEADVTLVRQLDDEEKPKPKSRKKK